MRRSCCTLAGALLAALCVDALAAEESFPALPTESSVVSIPAQEWPGAPGPRIIDVHLRYPEDRLENVGVSTGLMLSLHNWGGTGFRGAPEPDTLITAFDVVVIGVDYVQSGPFDASAGTPYDFGVYQAIDALQTLAWVWHGLEAMEQPFARKRIYTTGGSGGGNVSLMANKLAPRTFAAVVDLSGMARLSDDIAFGEAGGSSLHAGYSRDATSAQSLSAGAQVIRDTGYRPHLEKMAELGNGAVVLSVHGSEDRSCLFPEKWKTIANMDQAGLKARLHAVYPAGAVPAEVPNFVIPHEAGQAPFNNAEHSLGNRTTILMTVARGILEAGSPDAALRQGATDFERRDDKVRYVCPGGVYVVDYRSGYPVLSFDATTD